MKLDRKRIPLSRKKRKGEKISRNQPVHPKTQGEFRRKGKEKFHATS